MLTVVINPLRDGTAGGAYVSASTADGKEAGAPRVRAFAALPDWTGYWQTPWAEKTATVSGRATGGRFVEFLRTLPTLGKPPLLPEWEARYEAALADTAARQAEYMNFKGCGSGAVPMEETFPFVFEAPMVFQIVITPEETLFVFDHGQVRHVYTDGRQPPAPEDLWPTPMGFSLGSWQDGALVIETTARSAGPHRAVPVAGGAQRRGALHREAATGGPGHHRGRDDHR